MRTLIGMKTLSTKTDPKNVARRAKATAKRSAEADKIAADFKANQRMVDTVDACDTRDFDPARGDARPTHCSKCGYSYSDHMRVWAIAKAFRDSRNSIA